MYIRSLQAIIIILCVLGTHVHADQDITYTFGVVPQFDARQTHRIWRPLLTALEKKTGLRFKLVGSPNIPGFEVQFKSEEFDFAYMNPYQVYKSIVSGSYIPLVRDVGTALHGIIVVHKDSKLRRVEDLAEKQVAFPDPNALGASLVTRADIKNIYGVEVQPVYVQTHSSVYLSVAMGEADAGGRCAKNI